MSIQLLAGSFLMAAGMSYGNSAQIHTPTPVTPQNAATPSSADPYIQVRLRQKQAQEQGVSRLRAENAALIAKGVASHKRQLAASTGAERQRPAAAQKVSLPTPAQ